MIITQISPQRKKGRYNLFIDNEFFGGVGEEAIVKNQLKVGKEVSKDEIYLAIFASEEKSAFEKLLSLLSRQMYTKQQLRQKLYNCGYSHEVINSALNKAEEYKYVDDEMFARLFVDSKKDKSKLELKSLLMKKGIEKTIIEEYTESITLQQEIDNAVLFANKYMKNKEINQKSLSGLYGYLSRKGFCLEAVNCVLRKYKSDILEE